MHADSPFLSTLNPDPGAQRAALAAALLSLLVFAVLAPLAKTPLAPVQGFLPVYQSALILCDLITAALLWGQFRILRSRALLLLGAGYLFGALMALAHMLSFPGLFAPRGLLGAGPQTTAWLYFLWHGGFPVFFIGYALLRREAPRPGGQAAGSIALAAALACAAAGSLVLLATAGHTLLPPIMAGDSDAPTKVIVATLTWAIGLGALALLWRRRPHSVLDLWLMVTLCVWTADSALAAVFNHARFDLGWYAGRIYGLAANAFVLLVLLLENGLLHARLAQAHALLGQRNTQLAEASRLKSEFLANMSHELRTPLNAVIGFSEVLRDGLAGELSPAQRGYVADIHSSGQHLLAVINDILDLSKIEAGQMSLDLAPTAAGTLFEHSLSIVREQAARRGVRLRLDLAPGLGTLAVDARKTRQIVYNLLSNGVKFCGDGGMITLRAQRVTQAQVQAWSAPDPTVLQRPPPPTAGGHFLQIEVEDTGIGIAPADAPRLFRMFSQLDASLTRETEGTGLGLALVERLARLHGGGVALASTPGQGSRFLVWLPWRDPAEGAAPAAPAAPAMALPPTVRPLALLIEDNDSAAELMRVQLEPEGFEVARVASARAALDWLAQARPAVLILDLLLPDMDGWDLLARLKREDSPAAHVPVVIVSIVADAGRGFALGASAVLQKPVSREELLAALQDAGIRPAAPSSRVLIVDDDPRAVELLATYLQGPAYEVLRAHGGQEGIEAAHRERPDLIVLDLMMPGTSGFDVVAVLKQSPQTALIPIVVVTAKALTPQDKALLHGMVAVVLQKAAFDQNEFLGEVRRVAARRETTA